MSDVLRGPTRSNTLGLVDPAARRQLLARDGVVLERAEVMVLLDLVDADTIIGLPTSMMVSPTPKQRDATLAHGQALLSARGWLGVGADGLRTLPAEMLALALLITRPQVISLTIRNLHGQGKQLYLHAYADGLAVEQSFPQEGLHRFVALEGVEQICERIVGVLPTHHAFPAPYVADVSQDIFLAAKQLMEQRHVPDAEAILGVAIHSVPIAQALTHAFTDPSLIATVAVFRCAEQPGDALHKAGAGVSDAAPNQQGVRIVDARNIALACDEDSAWLVEQRAPGVPLLKLQYVEPDVLYYRLRAHFDAMRAPAEHVLSANGDASSAE